MVNQELYDRIMARCVETPGPLDTPCMVWQRSFRNAGYGQIRVGPKKYDTHKAAYIAMHGPVPDGLCVMHECDVRACCNVVHMKVGTNEDNLRDCLLKGRRAKTFRKLTREQVIEIRRLFSVEGISTIKLAAWFNVTRPSISCIVNGKSYTSLLPTTQEKE